MRVDENGSYFCVSEPTLFGQQKNQNLMFKGGVYLCTDCFGDDLRIKATMGVLITTIIITTITTIITITISLIFIFLTPSP